jgi:hypothetical protein
MIFFQIPRTCHPFGSLDCIWLGNVNNLPDTLHSTFKLYLIVSLMRDSSRALGHFSHIVVIGAILEQRRSSLGGCRALSRLVRICHDRLERHCMYYGTTSYEQGETAM